MTRMNEIPVALELRPRRYFSAAEANRALVLVRRIVSDIVMGYARLMDVQELAEASRSHSVRGVAAQAELTAIAQRLQQYAAELDDVGVELKDWSMGIVDFPTFVDGHEAYLCWRLGEDRVDHWHRLDEESDQRTPLTGMLA